MRIRKTISAWVVVIFFCTWIIGPVLAQEAGDNMADIFKKDIKPAEDLLPAGVTVADGFEAGPGDAIGRVKSATGRALVVHQNGTRAFVLAKKQDLYMGDMIITGEGTQIQAELYDESALSVASYTKLVIDRSVYDGSQRDSYLRLLFGKVRFLVAKVATGKEDYQIRTATATIGVRGSDFAVSVAPTDQLAQHKSKWWDWLAGLSLVSTAHAQPAEQLATTVVTGDETTVSFTGDVGPTRIVGPNMISRAIAGMAATVPVALTAAVAAGALGSAGAVGAVSGMSTAAIVGIGAGVAAAAGGTAAAAVSASDSDDDDDGGSSGGGTTACNSLTTAGGDVPETHTVEMGQTSGTFTFSWEMYSIPDQMIVKYEGSTLFDTGCVSGSSSTSISYAGSSTTVTVEVNPSCDGSSGTSWNFTASCPH